MDGERGVIAVKSGVVAVQIGLDRHAHLAWSPCKSLEL
jgi:hypothetical protein